VSTSRSGGEERERERGVIDHTEENPVTSAITGPGQRGGRLPPTVAALRKTSIRFKLAERRVVSGRGLQIFNRVLHIFSDEVF